MLPYDQAYSKSIERKHSAFDAEPVRSRIHRHDGQRLERPTRRHPVRGGAIASVTSQRREKGQGRTLVAANLGRRASAAATGILYRHDLARGEGRTVWRVLKNELKDAACDQLRNPLGAIDLTLDNVPQRLRELVLYSPHTAEPLREIVHDIECLNIR